MAQPALDRQAEFWDARAGDYPDPRAPAQRDAVDHLAVRGIRAGVDGLRRQRGLQGRGAVGISGS